MAKYSKDSLLADFHTGSYTQRELSEKHQVSIGTVNRLTKGVKKKTEQLINKKIEVYQESKELNEQELNAVEHSYQFKIGLLSDIETFTNSAISKAQDLLTTSDTGSDFSSC